MTKKNLVTGAAGLIGFEIANELLRAGESVIAIDNFKKGGKNDLQELYKLYGEKLLVIEADLCDPLIFRNISEPLKAVYHFAAIVGVDYVNNNPYETMHVNMLSTLNTIDMAIRCSCEKFLFASSSENYASAVEAGWVGLPTPEDVPLCITNIELPRWSYAASKIGGESAVFGASKLSNFVPIIIRFHNVYGPRMGPTHVIPELIQRVLKKTDPFPIYGYDATRSFLHVEDAARAVKLIADKASMQNAGIFNVGASEEISIADIAELIFEISGFHPKVDIQSAPPGSVKRRVPDVSRLKSLGFSPKVSLKDGISSCYKRNSA
jgi:UDP-glucose 4-epimerase/UDP-glucuronate decarboxylase